MRKKNKQLFFLLRSGKIKSVLCHHCHFVVSKKRQEKAKMHEGHRVKIRQTRKTHKLKRKEDLPLFSEDLRPTYPRNHQQSVKTRKHTQKNV